MKAFWRKPRADMLAIDTNILVRALTGDHPEQAERVERLFSSNQIFIATTVLLETEWVLRRTFKYPKAKVLGALRALLYLPQVRMEHHERTTRALNLAEAGADFADALHYVAADGCEQFVTFDKGLAKVAAGLPTQVAEP